jgi:phage tail-like protein
MPESLLPPPVAFHFTVGFGLLPPALDSSFQEVGGISPEIETETVAEGGENRFQWQLPKTVKNPRLTLKRGVAGLDSTLVRWCRKVLEGGLVQPVETKTVNVFLLDGAGLPLRAWAFANAWPVRWEVETFNATKNELALEKIELAYTSVKREL